MTPAALRVLLLLLVLSTPPAATATRTMPAAPASGTLTGLLTDPVTGAPLAHVLVTVGYLTPGFRRATETDAHGRYVITGLPPTTARGIDTYAFAEGYIYHHGTKQVILAGKTTTYAYHLPRDIFAVRHPRVTSYDVTRVNGHTVRFAMEAVEGKDSFSDEMFAISPHLGYLVVLRHGHGQHYDGTLTVPPGTKHGIYRFYYVATQNDCISNETFPYRDVMLG